MGFLREERRARLQQQGSPGLARTPDSYRVRNANAAHLNGFEAFPAFAAGVLMAQFAGVDPGRISTLAVAFVALRILHGIFYLTGTQALRSVVWLGGFASVLGLMVLAALKVA